MKNNTGHNLTDTQKALKAIIDAIENYQNQKKDIDESLAEIRANAKNKGFDVKIINQILKIRKNPDKATEERQLIDAYCENLGMTLFDYKGE